MTDHEPLWPIRYRLARPVTPAPVAPPTDNQPTEESMFIPRGHAAAKLAAGWAAKRESHLSDAARYGQSRAQSADDMRLAAECERLRAYWTAVADAIRETFLTACAIACSGIGAALGFVILHALGRTL